jgi:metal-sulfur cluster biosynthetic enzyme
MTLLTGLLAALGCAGQLDTTVALPAHARVVVVDRVADVRVTGTTRTDLRLTATAPPRGCVVVEVIGNDVEVRVRRAAAREDTRATLTLSVPDGVAVVVRVMAGAIAVRDVRAPVELASKSASIVAERLGATLTAHAVSGDVTVANVARQVTLRSTEGALRVRGLLAGGSVSTISGQADYVGALPSRLTMESWSGPLRIGSMTSESGEKSVTVSSYSGSISLDIDDGADVQASTISGRIVSQLPIISSTPRSRQYRIGKGGASVDVFSRTGTITIE